MAGKGFGQIKLAGVRWALGRFLGGGFGMGLGFTQTVSSALECGAG